MVQCLMVGLGGGIGAILRYLLGKLPISTIFPFTTLGINIAGAFLIGLVVSSAAKYHTEEVWILFLKTGICGGFTTFSTFSLESMTLLEEGKVTVALVYMVVSVVLCLAGVWLGKRVFL